MLEIYLNSYPLFSVVGQSTVEVPSFLEETVKTDMWVLEGLLLIAFLLLALAKRLEYRLFAILIPAIFNLGTTDSLQRFETRFNTAAFALISIVFVLSFWVDTSLFLHYAIDNNDAKLQLLGMDIEHNHLILIGLLSAVFVFIHLFLGFMFTSALTGEKSLFNTYLSQTWTNMLSFSLLFFMLALIWVLNPSFNHLMSQLFIYLLIAFYLFRFIKLLITSLGAGVRWYYLFLYLCTLEILPMVLIYHYVVGEK
jgi:hypothetical protein